MSDQNINQRRILIITYVFPPAGGVMVQRVLKFVKYLHHFGWHPTVLTVRNPDYKMSDQELLRDVPDETEIIRTSTWEPSKTVNVVRSWFRGIRAFLLNRTTTTNQMVQAPTPRRSFLEKLNTFIFVPDNRVGWLPFAVSALVKRSKQVPFDVIFSTSPPFSVHLVGLIAKSITRKPWVADLRDLWVLNPHKKPPTKIHLRVSKYIEHKVLKTADKILTVSESLDQDLKKTYPDIVSEKFEVISNGYDADDFKNNTVKQSQKLSMGHVGSFYTFSGRTPYYLLIALAELKREIPDLERRMEAFFVGAMDEDNKRIVNSIISESHLEGVVRFCGFLPHREAISYLKRLDILLFFIVTSGEGCPSSRGSVSGKLYEYVATGKPILALTEEGPIRDFISKSGCGILVDYNDTQKIKEEILDCYNRFKEGRLTVKPNWDFITRFERKELTRRLGGILDRLNQGTAQRKGQRIAR